MGSKPLEKARKIAEEYDCGIKATDPRLRRSVIVICQDEATVLTYDWAFALKYGEWFFVFSEHHPPQVYHEEAAYVIQRGERLEIEEYENSTCIPQDT